MTNVTVGRIIDAVVRVEGWGLFEVFNGDDAGKLMIQKIDEDNTFKSDAGACEFVKNLSDAGSWIRQMAISVAQN